MKKLHLKLSKNHDSSFFLKREDNLDVVVVAFLCCEPQQRYNGEYKKVSLGETEKCCFLTQKTESGKKEFFKLMQKRMNETAN